MRLENESITLNPSWTNMATSVILPFAADCPVVSMSIMAYKSFLFGVKIQLKQESKYFRSKTIQTSVYLSETRFNDMQLPYPKILEWPNNQSISELD